MASVSLWNGRWAYDAAFVFSGAPFLIGMTATELFLDLTSRANSTPHFFSPICPNTANHTLLCEDVAMRRQIENHLLHSPSGSAYMLFICLGCILSLLHDVGLLLKRPESLTLIISITSLFCQCVACLC